MQPSSPDVRGIKGLVADSDSCAQLSVAFDLERDWQMQGTCFNNPIAHRLMFSWDPEDQKKAGEHYCDVCPVKALCYAWALVYEERGYWGGTTQRERDERRPYLIADVLTLWPRLYARWSGSDEDGGGESVEVPTARESDVTPILTEQEEQRQRVRMRAFEADDPVRWGGTWNPLR